ncbi:MAG TPA: hypothetical protein VJJ23_03730 [Candidatus Nanoarchaeia archaeon]|nr:hypothetical protein [Candidatus Nanoarchaeia archaeon]
MNIENIALFDLDGTLCDYDKGLSIELEKLRSPSEPPIQMQIRDTTSKYLKNRADLIRLSESWWENLPKFKLGWDVLEVAKELEYKIMILTQGPKTNPSSWSGKKRWMDKNLGEDVDITITRDKGLVYGKVLVDDFPEYIERWLKHRKRGLVIMPANNGNLNYKHHQVIRYNGENLEEVRIAMEKRVKLKV